MIFLFDLDGVLVQPGGYRAAVRETVNYFARQMGLGELAPDDETVAIYESQGFTCEWDMVPVTIALILEAASERLDPSVPLDSLQSACAALSARGMDGLRVDYAPNLRRLARFVRPGEAPAESLLAAVERGEAPDFFPRLAGQGVLRELFTHTRHPARSRTTHVFETFVLGDAAYSSAMGLPAEVRAESTLARYDQPLLAPETRDRLLQIAASGAVPGGLHMAAYTARPSAPAEAPSERLAVYAPEAEMALALVGLDTIALVGSGQVGEAASHLGEAPDRLTKPAPYHALMAAAAAITGDRPAALRWTEDVFRYFERSGRRPAALLPARLELHVFEDSPTGMAGAREAAEMLRRLGSTVELRLWGVSSHPDKVRALEAQGARVFEDVNQALRKII